MSMFLACLCLAVIGLGGYAFARGDRGIFGRPLVHPRWWASGVMLLGLSGLVKLADIEGIHPHGWKLAVQIVYGTLTAAFVVILVVQAVLQAKSDG